MIGDHDLGVAKLYDMLPADTQGTSEGRTAATNATVRTVFIIGGAISNDEAKELFGDFEAPKPYLRIIPQPE